MLFLEIESSNVFSATWFLGLQTTIHGHKPLLSCFCTWISLSEQPRLCSPHQRFTYEIQISQYFSLIKIYTFLLCKHRGTYTYTITFFFLLSLYITHVLPWQYRCVFVDRVSSVGDRYEWHAIYGNSCLNYIENPFE